MSAFERNGRPHSSRWDHAAPVGQSPRICREHGAPRWPGALPMTLRGVGRTRLWVGERGLLRPRFQGGGKLERRPSMRSGKSVLHEGGDAAGVAEHSGAFPEAAQSLFWLSASLNLRLVGRRPSQLRCLVRGTASPLATPLVCVCVQRAQLDPLDSRRRHCQSHLVGQGRA